MTTKRFFQAWRLLLAASLLLIGPAGIFPAQAQTPPTKPNVLFFLTDDQDLLLDSLDYMPNLKALIADNGATFSNYFVPLSLCCPSRTTLLTGEYTHNHEVFTNGTPDGGFQKAYSSGLESSTIATEFQSAHYRTVLLGKYLNGYPDTASPTYIPPGWSEWYVPAAGNPYTNFNYTLNENGTLVPYGSAPEDYLTDVIAGKAAGFIERAAAAKSPFFMYLATYAPHQPATPAPRHANLFPGIKAPRTPSFNEPDVSDKPEFIRKLPLLRPKDIASIDDLYRKRLQSLQAVDEAIASLVKTLKATGQLANTYFVFTSDNGYHEGQHRQHPGKYTAYEEDIHLPLFVRGPSVRAGLKIGAYADEVDLAATFLSMAGLPIPPSADGRSLLPLWSAPPAPSWRKMVFVEQYPFKRNAPPPVTNGTLEPLDPADLLATDPSPFYQGLRTHTYKYIEYGTGEKEFYDLVRDRNELHNQASRLDPAFQAQLAAAVQAFAGCAGNTCRSAEQIPLPPSPIYKP
jgi:N-acetylglucosamine-6-sulfatase